jgi:tetratricopeptide (TPR) repeat protein
MISLVNGYAIIIIAITLIAVYVTTLITGSCITVVLIPVIPVVIMRQNHSVDCKKTTEQTEPTAKGEYEEENHGVEQNSATETANKYIPSNKRTLVDGRRNSAGTVLCSEGSETTYLLGWGTQNITVIKNGPADDQSHPTPVKDPQLENRILNKNGEMGAHALVGKVESGRTPRAVLYLAFVLTLCPKQGVSKKLLQEGSGALKKGFEDMHIPVCYGILDLLNMLCNHLMVRTGRPNELVALDRDDLKIFQSLEKYAQVRNEVSEVYCSMLLDVLAVRQPSVCAFHREAAQLAEDFLENPPNNLSALKEAMLYLALGKRLAKVGPLKGAFNYIEMAISRYERHLDSPGSEMQRQAIDQMAVDAFLAKGKLARRQGGDHSLDRSLKYLQHAMEIQMSIDDCRTRLASTEAARIRVANCETLFIMGQYAEAKQFLESEDLRDFVAKDNAYHSAQYWSNLGCTCSFTGDHRQACDYLSKALEANEEDTSDYRRPLYLSLLARSLVLWAVDPSPRDPLPDREQLLLDAEKHCTTARSMLKKDHGEHHRFFALNESFMASVMFAKATVSQLEPWKNTSFMILAVWHAKKALGVFLKAYDNNMNNPNIASAMHLIGDICAFLSRKSCHGTFTYCQPFLETIYQKSCGNQGQEAPSSAEEYACYFYKSTLDIYRRCCSRFVHPSCSKIQQALQDLHTVTRQ